MDYNNGAVSLHTTPTINSEDAGNLCFGWAEGHSEIMSVTNFKK